MNEEVGLLLRLCGDQRELIRSRLKREKALKLKVDPSPGKLFSVEEQERMLPVALASTQAARLACERQTRVERPAKGDKQGGSPSIYPALVLALNCGMRDAEIRGLTWSQIDWEKKILTVGRSETDAGTGRTIPLNGTLLDALVDHTRWYSMRFGDAKPEWYMFPGGGDRRRTQRCRSPHSRPEWNNVRKKAGGAGGTIAGIR